MSHLSLPMPLLDAQSANYAESDIISHEFVYQI
jgi:hypothetical protein